MNTEASIEDFRKWHEGGFFVINGREYKLHNLTHSFRTEVLAVFGNVAPLSKVGNFSFLTNPEFKSVMKKIDDRITFENNTITKIGNHFETYPEDYMEYVVISLQVIVYPFYRTKLKDTE